MNVNEDAIEELQEYIERIKDGYVRGDAKSRKVADNVVVEISVASFEMGHIHLRVWVDEPELEPTKGTYYRKLFRMDKDYRGIHEKVGSMLEEVNERPIELGNVWEAEHPDRAEDYPWLHEDLNAETTVAFEDHVQVRDDVSVQEAILTNRRESIETERPGNPNQK